MPVKNSKILISLFPPDETTISYFPFRALNKSLSISRYLFFPLTSISIKLSILSVKSLTPLLRGSKASVISESGNSFFKDMRVGRKNISSPMPPKFIVRILFPI